jgi:hypothetical protein
MIHLKRDYFENVETPQHKEFIHTQGHCVLCRNKLELRHFPQKQDHQIREEAYCPECDVRARAKVYTLN